MKCFDDNLEKRYIKNGYYYYYYYYYYPAWSTLKPKDSFGEFNKFFLDFQKVQEIIRKHHQTFLQLFGMTYCNAILPNGKLSLCKSIQSVRGDSEHFYVLVIS